MTLIHIANHASLRKSKLTLASEYEAFTFAKEPIDAAELLKECDQSSSVALKMVMQQAAETPDMPAVTDSHGSKKTETSRIDDGSAVDSADDIARATVYKTVGEPGAAQGDGLAEKAPQDDNQRVTVYKTVGEQKPGTQSAAGDEKTGTTTAEQEMGRQGEDITGKLGSSEASKETDIKLKESTETVGQESVFCCCSFW